MKIILWTTIVGTLFFLCNLPFKIKTIPVDSCVVTIAVKTVDSIVAQYQYETLSVALTGTLVLSYAPTPTYTGINYQFVICSAKKGEDLSQYAEEYNTSAGAILRVNYSLNLPLWEEELVVIPVGFTEVTQMPYFKPYKVTAESITVDDLAIELATDLNDLKYYNNLTGLSMVKAGYWG